MNNKKNYKKQKLKRKANQDDLTFHTAKPGPRLSKKKKSKSAFAKKRLKMSSQTSSSTASSKDNNDGSDGTLKSQCDLCKLSYSSKDKLKEHLVSLMHHTRLEDAGENPKHDCTLCDRNFTDMASYRDHIGTKKHLKNLEFLRDPNKERQEKNQKWKQNSRNRRDNGFGGQDPRYQNPGRYNNFGWQEPDFPRGLNYQNPYFNSSGPNLMGLPGFDSQGPNTWLNNKNYNNNGWDRQYEPWKERMEFENYNNTERNLPWGSGVLGHNINEVGNNFARDNFDYCWDEQSFQQHEDFLANMDQGHHRDSVEFHPRGRPPQHLNYPHQGGGRHDRPDTGYSRKWRWEDSSSYNDRKRPRNEDAPPDPTAKSSRSLDKEGGFNEKVNEETQNSQSKPSSAPKSKPTQQTVTRTVTPQGYERTTYQDKSSLDNVTRTVTPQGYERATRQDKSSLDNVTRTVTPQGYERTTYQDKSSLDNASDSILERAEKLCKELREKREASSTHRASLLKTQTQHSLNDKMNNLKKSKQSYLKGHIKSTDQISSEDNVSTVSAISSTPALPEASKERLSQSKLTSSSKSKTLDEIRKSIEQSVLDDSKNAASAAQQSDKIRSRVRASSLSESPTAQNVHSKGRGDPVADNEGRLTRPFHKPDGIGGGSKPGSKQPITKENLNKMVNCPRSRTERLQLARMYQSRADGKSSAHASSRPNINLEGTYDAPDIADIEIDVGGNMPTIKLEDLSDDVRSQILGLIQDDIGSQVTESSCNEHAKEVIEIDGDETNETGTSHGEFLTREADSTDKKLKKKSQKKSKLAPKSLTNSESGKSPKTSAVGGTLFNKKAMSDKVNSVTPTSPRLTSDNVLSRYPTILGTMGTNTINLPTAADKKKSSSNNTGKDKDSIDSGISSLALSLSSSSSPTPVSMLSSSIPSSSYKSSGLPLQTQTQSSVSMPPPASTLPAPLEEAVSLLNRYPLHRTAQPKDISDVGTSITSSLGTDVPSNTMSELLSLSEQEESVKQEMMTMELRLTRLHRLLEQAVYQINKCTERRNELQDEEKSLTSRRLSLLREATSSSQQSSTTSSVAIAPSSQMNTESSVSTSKKSASQPLPSATELPSTQQQDLHIPESTLSRTEWLAKFSAYLPSSFTSSSKESTTSKALSSSSQPPQTSETDRTKTKQSGSSSAVLSAAASALAQSQISPDPTSRLQMVPERDLEPIVGKESYTSYNPTSRRNGNEALDSGSKDVGAGDSYARASADKYPGVAQEFTSPIMYLGTIKSGTAQNRLPDKTAPVMMLNSATLSSLFSGGSDRGESVNPVKIVGLGDQGDPNRVESTFPPVVRRSSLGSPRQEDSDIGSIASVASGSSLGEQITRYCRFTPGASADGRNPHELSVILSGPSDTSDLRGLEEDDNFGESRARSDDDATTRSTNLMEDAGNNRLYGRLDQETIKSAEALHLMERNNDVPSSVIDKKKKKRKTKHQRDSGIKGRPKPYVISSSSGDENKAKKNVTDENCVSSLEQRSRKSPESTDDDSSDLPIVTIGRQSQQSKSDQGKSMVTHITIAECDSSTNLGMVDSQSLNESSSRLKEMNESFEKTFGRKPRMKAPLPTDFQSPEGNVVVLSDDSENNHQEPHQSKSNSDIIDLCGDDDIQQSSKVRGSLQLEKDSRYPGKLGPVCFLRCLGEKIYVGFLKSGFKVFFVSSEDSIQRSTIPASDRLHPFPKLSSMEVANLGDGDRVCLGCGHWVIAVNMKAGKREDLKTIDMGTTVKCVHIMRPHLYTGLDTGEMCVHDIKSWKLINRYICSDCPIQCMASGLEGGTKVLCVASMDSTITVVDAERCLPLRILTGHSNMAFSVEVHCQYVFSGSKDGAAIIHNLHTASTEKVFKDNKGVVNSVFYSDGHLFTGGIDRLVRVYNIKSHKLVQVYYGAGAGIVKTIFVYQNKLLITGNSSGSVDLVDLDLNAKFLCKRKKCGLNFGLASHLAWHVEQDH